MNYNSYFRSYFCFQLNYKLEFAASASYNGQQHSAIVAACHCGRKGHKNYHGKVHLMDVLNSTSRLDRKLLFTLSNDKTCKLEYVTNVCRRCPRDRRRYCTVHYTNVEDQNNLRIFCGIVRVVNTFSVYIQ